MKEANSTDFSQFGKDSLLIVLVLIAAARSEDECWDVYMFVLPMTDRCTFQYLVGDLLKSTLHL
jgi:hypothetical protein